MSALSHLGPQQRRLKRLDLIPIHVDIIGPGALGLHLALSMPPDAVVRLRHPDFSAGSVALSYVDSSTTRRVETLSLTDPAPIRCALFTTKAFQVVPALRAILPQLDDAADVVLLHNGLGPQDAACALYSGNVWVGTTTEGALRTDKWQVQHTGRGQTIIGPWRTATDSTQTATDEPAVMHLLRRSLWASSWAPSTSVMHQHIWRKVIINCAINPMTALHNLRNGELLNPEWVAQWQDIVVEAVAVANAQHLSFDPEAMVADAHTVMQATAENYSSMHQDWHYGRATEADLILGAVVRYGAQSGIATPRISALLDALMAGKAC
ncbi:2-dehydropantoate 2-reductase [Salinispirillum sp. LH 10-3-1]|uniref:2-dehydropantoate 2-reductase n=1 Tax=Salinispirillum sp. LH 10-3-1 TaxID=2952525 RepID=A0AB38YII4_9GAMM